MYDYSHALNPAADKEPVNLFIISVTEKRDV